MDLLHNIWVIFCVIVINIYHTICFLVKLLVFPFIKLYRWIRGKVECTGVGITLDCLNDTFHHFNGFIPFCLFIIGAIFSLVLLLMRIGVEGGLLEYAQVLAYHTPIGAFAGFFNEGLNFTPETAVSIAFSGALFSACMGNEKPEGFLGYLIHFLRHVVFFATFAHLAVMLTGLFKVVGDWGYNTIVTLYNTETDSFLSGAGKILALILLCYPAIELFLLAVKEYAECILLGVLFLLFCLVLALVVQYVLDISPEMQDILISGILLVVLFGVDLFRPYVDVLLNNILSKYSFYPEGWIDEFGEE